MKHAVTSDLTDRHQALNKEVESWPKPLLFETVAHQEVKRERCFVKDEIAARARSGDREARAYALVREWVTESELGWKPEVLEGDAVAPPTMEPPLENDATVAA